MRVADAGHDGGDGAILAIECHTALGTIPADGSQAPLDGRDAVGFRAALGRPGRTGCDVQTNDFRIRGQGRQILTAAPSGKMLPI
jgi:hypothetical protein